MIMVASWFRRCPNPSKNGNGLRTECSDQEQRVKVKLPDDDVAVGNDRGLCTS